MKRFILICILVLALVIGNLIADECESFIVVLSTFDVIGTGGGINTAADLQISSSTRMSFIRHFNISNSDYGHDQIVTFYDGFTNSVSTAAVLPIWVVHLSSAITGTNPWQESFGDRWGLKCDYGLAIRKSNTSSAVRVSVQYR